MGECSSQSCGLSVVTTEAGAGMPVHGKPGKNDETVFPTLVCCFLRREDVFTFRRRGRSHPRPVLTEPDAKIGRRPSLFMLWRIGGLWSLHVQGQQKEQVRGRGQGRLLKPILVPKEVYEQADHRSL